MAVTGVLVDGETMKRTDLDFLGVCPLTLVVDGGEDEVEGWLGTGLLVDFGVCRASIEAFDSTEGRRSCS